MGAKLGFITPTVMQVLEFFLENSLNEYHQVLEELRRIRRAIEEQ